MINNFKNTGFVHTTEQVGTRTRFGWFRNYEEPVFATFLREHKNPEVALGIFDFEDKHRVECQRVQIEANKDGKSYLVMGPGIYESWVHPEELK